MRNFAIVVGLSTLCLNSFNLFASEDDVRFDRLMGAVNRLEYLPAPLATADRPYEKENLQKNQDAQELKLDPYVDQEQTFNS